MKYSRLDTDEDGGNNYSDDGNIKGRRRQYDARFDYTPKYLDKVPWKSILLALFLLLLGSFLLFLSFFIFTGHMGGERSQAYGLLALGFLTFLPGIQSFPLLCFYFLSITCVLVCVGWLEVGR